MAEFGSSPQLRRLIDRFRGVATPGSKAREDFARVVGASALSALMREFREGRDPYGNPWRPLKRPSKRRGGPAARPLMDTGRLRASFSVQPKPAGFELSTRVVYAAPHQYGAPRANIPQRQMVPMATTGGIGSWGNAMNRSASRWLRGYFEAP